MPQPENEDRSTGKLQPVDYYRKRFDLLIFPSLLINGYYAVFLGLVYFRHLVVRHDGQSIGPLPIICQVIILFITPILGYTAIRESRQVSLWSLVACTILFIFTITFPVYFWGGSNGSFFSPILATVSGLTVIFTTSRRTRALFAGLCIALFIGCSWWYVDIVPTSDIVLPHKTGIQLYRVFQTSSAVVSILVTLILAWRSKNIFGDSE
jgi:hypothetical protein